MALRVFFLQTPGKYFAQDKSRALQKFATKKKEKKEMNNNLDLLGKLATWIFTLNKIN